MNKITLNLAKSKDIDYIIDLLYDTEPYPEFEWGNGSEKEMKDRLHLLFNSKNNRFSLENILVCKDNNNFVGFILFLHGSKIKRQTYNSDIKILPLQKNIKCKIKFLFDIAEYTFYKECEKDELYISNIAIAPSYRGKGYSDILLNKIYELANQYGLKKVSLTANNDSLVNFYSKIGFQVTDSKKRKMIKYI